MKRSVIGVDLGGTNIKTVLLDARDLLPRNRAQSDTQAAHGVKQVVANIVCAIGEQTAWARAHGYAVRSIGIGSAGLVDRGTVRNSPNLPGWQGSVPLQRLIEKGLQPDRTPVFIENDVNCFVVAERRLGAGRGWNNVIGLTLGCIEALVGAEAITARYRIQNSEFRIQNSDLTVARIALLARQKNAAALRTFAETGRLLGVGLANIVNTFNPQAVIIGGGVAQSGRLIIGPAVAEMRKRAMPYNARAVKVRTAKLGPLAGAIGAALVALQK